MEWKQSRLIVNHRLGAAEYANESNVYQDRLRERAKARRSVAIRAAHQNTE